MTTSPTIAPVTSASQLRLVLILGSLTAFAPMSMDLYLPAFPEVTRHFGVSEASVQLTLTSCLAGLALGQLLAGPYSDAMGRRRPLLIGLAVYVAASVGCALAPSAAVLTGLRLVQGLAGAAGLVIARAVVRDLYSGVTLAWFFSLLMLVNGIAPILAPLIGSQLIQVMPWQGLFAVLAGYGLLLLVGTGFGLPETLPPSARHRGGLRATGRVVRELLGDRRFVGYALSSGLVFAAMFSYVAGSSFVLQQVYGLSPQLYGVAFAVNALGIAALGLLNGLLLRRLPPRRLLAAGLVLAALGGVGVITAVLAGLGLPAVLPALFIVVASIGVVLPNATALALSGRPEQAGSASALLGVLQYLFGALVAPLVGVLGAGTAVPMAALMCGLTLGGLVMFALTWQGRPQVLSVISSRSTLRLGMLLTVILLVVGVGISYWTVSRARDIPVSDLMVVSNGQGVRDGGQATIQIPGTPPPHRHLALTLTLTNLTGVGDCVNPARLDVTPVIDGQQWPSINGLQSHRETRLSFTGATYHTSVVVTVHMPDSSCTVDLNVDKAILYD